MRHINTFENKLFRGIKTYLFVDEVILRNDGFYELIEYTNF